MHPSLITLAVFAAIASVCAGVLFGIQRLFQLRRGRSDSELQRELRKLPKLRDDTDGAGSVEKFDAWFERTLYMSGLNMTPTEGALLVVLVALSGGGAAFLATDSAVLTMLAAVLFGLIVFGMLVGAGRRRLDKFESQFPTALDLLARAVRAGESFDQSLALVGEAAAEPVGIELRRCARQIELGLPVPVCMQGLAQRVGAMDVRIFANAILSRILTSPRNLSTSSCG